MSQQGLDDFAETVESVAEDMDEDSDEWPMRNIEEVCQLNPDSVNDNDFDYEEILYLDLSSTGNGYIKELQKYDWEDSPSRAQRTVQEGDSVVATVRPANCHYVFIEDPPENLVISSGFVVLRPKESVDLDERYLYYAVTHPRFIDFLDANATGSAYPAANLSVVKRGEIPVPDLEIQQKIGQSLGSLDQKIKHNLKEIDKLLELRELLHPELLPESGSGESRVGLDEF